MRLALLADLHFGTVAPDLATGLLAALAEERPDAVLIAGDFVQRVRASQFRLACRFLDALPAPWHAVPGNHDLPLFNLFARLSAPRAAYRRWISPETEFTRVVGTVPVIGLDTTTRWRHQRGNVSAAQVDRVAAALRGATGGPPPVILAHHPFHQAPDVTKQPTLGAPDALAAWAECRPHLLLTGHLHNFHVEPFVARRGAAGRTLQVHCGTSLSTRQRGTRNDFAMIGFEGDTVRIERFEHSDGAGFAGAQVHTFTAEPGGWKEG